MRQASDVQLCTVHHQRGERPKDLSAKNWSPGENAEPEVWAAALLHQYKRKACPGLLADELADALGIDRGVSPGRCGVPPRSGKRHRAHFLRPAATLVGDIARALELLDEVPTNRGAELAILLSRAAALAAGGGWRGRRSPLRGRSLRPGRAAGAGTGAPRHAAAARGARRGPVPLWVPASAPTSAAGSANAAPSSASVTAACSATSGFRWRPMPARASRGAPRGMTTTSAGPMRPCPTSKTGTGGPRPRSRLVCPGGGFALGGGPAAVARPSRCLHLGQDRALRIDWVLTAVHERPRGQPVVADFGAGAIFEGAFGRLAHACAEDHRFGAWQVRPPPAGPGLLVTEMFTGLTVYAAVRPAAPPPPWCVLLTLMVPDEGIWRPAGGTVALTPAQGEAFVRHSVRVRGGTGRRTAGNAQEAGSAGALRPARRPRRRLGEVLGALRTLDPAAAVVGERAERPGVEPPFWAATGGGAPGETTDGAVDRRVATWIETPRPSSPGSRRGRRPHRSCVGCGRRGSASSSTTPPRPCRRPVRPRHRPAPAPARLPPDARPSRPLAGEPASPPAVTGALGIGQAEGSTPEGNDGYRATAAGVAERR